MTHRPVIEIQPHRYGWVCIAPVGLRRVFVLRPQAIQFAQRECAAREILVRSRDGAIEQTLRFDIAA